MFFRALDIPGSESRLHPVALFRGGRAQDTNFDQPGVRMASVAPLTIVAEPLRGTVTAIHGHLAGLFAAEAGDVRATGSTGKAVRSLARATAIAEIDAKVARAAVTLFPIAHFAEGTVLSGHEIAFAALRDGESRARLPLAVALVMHLAGFLAATIALAADQERDGITTLRFVAVLPALTIVAALATMGWLTPVGVGSQQGRSRGWLWR